ncbi:MAG: hypothetical protein IT204_09805 [Fimbriimonadaceae bacterium]|nr:hypothetical protein [Fimbriimonadaceae bacterium]
MPWQVGLPRAVQLVIDDVGWREGWSLANGGGPWRAGLDRLLGPADYQAIADLGAQLGIRPQAALVLCEWDPAALCARQPTATQAGAAWDNRRLAGDWTSQAARILAERAADLELTLHGVGHEHWDHGLRSRAEWYGRTSDGGRKWAWSDLQGHLELFGDLLDAHGLGPAAGHGFPRSFVPCAFNYLCDAADPHDTGALAAGAGCRWGSTPFSSLDRRTPLAADQGGLDHGLLLLDRGQSGVPWDAVDTLPPPLAADELSPVLADLAAATATCVPAELRRLLERRGDHLDELVAVYLPLVSAQVRLHAGRGIAAAELAQHGQRALREVLQHWLPSSGVELDTLAEAHIASSLRERIANAGPAPRHSASPGSIVGIHWPNLLAADPAANDQAVARWTAWLRTVATLPGHLLAANTRQCFAQWAWQQFGTVCGDDAGFTLDLRAVPAELREFLAEEPVIVEIGDYQRLGQQCGGELRPVWYQRAGDRAFLAVRLPASGVGSLRCDQTGPLQPIVLRSGSLHVTDLRQTASGLELELEVYGTATLELAPGFEPRAVEVAHGRLAIVARRDQPTLGLTRLRLQGADLQGAPATLRLLR